jgi:ribosomal protein L44E
VQAAREKSRRQARKQAGIGGTIKTPALLEEASTAKKTLL